MNPIKLVVAALFALLMVHDVAKPAAADYTVRCESRDGRYAFCSADTRRGVDLDQQLSDAGCWRGDTWGWNARGIWVNNGCRADFRVGSRGGDRDRSSNAAAAALAIGVIAAIAASSDDDHRDRDRYDRYPRHGNYRRTLRCESDDDERQYCAANLRGNRVEVARTLSKSPCNFNYSWGYDRRGIWVDRGCRADFAVW